MNGPKTLEQVKLEQFNDDLRQNKEILARVRKTKKLAKEEQQRKQPVLLGSLFPGLGTNKRGQR